MKRRHTGPRAFRPIMARTQEHLIVCGCPQPHKIRSGAISCAYTAQTLLNPEVLELDTTIPLSRQGRTQKIAPAWSCTHLRPWINEDTCAGCKAEITRRMARWQMRVDQLERDHLETSLIYQDADQLLAVPSL